MTLIVLSVISMIMGVSLSVIQNEQSKWAAKDRNKWQEVINKIATELSKNQNLLNDLQDAYNRRDAELAQAILTSAGFGAAYDKLKKTRENANKTFKHQQKIINDKTIELQNQYNEAVTKQSNSVGAIGNTDANQADSAMKKFNSTTTATDLINGGLITNENKQK